MSVASSNLILAFTNTDLIADDLIREVNRVDVVQVKIFSPLYSRHRMLKKRDFCFLTRDQFLFGPFVTDMLIEGPRNNIDNCTLFLFAIAGISGI